MLVAKERDGSEVLSGRDLAVIAPHAAQKLYLRRRLEEESNNMSKHCSKLVVNASK